MSDDTRRFATESSAWLGFAIAASLQEGVAANLELLRQHASRVLEFELSPGEDAAPVFAALPPAR